MEIKNTVYIEFDPRSSFVDNVFDCCLSGVSEYYKNFSGLQRRCVFNQVVPKSPKTGTYYTYNFVDPDEILIYCTCFVWVVALHQPIFQSPFFLG